MQFRDGVANAVRQVHNVDECIQQSLSIVAEWGGWSIIDDDKRPVEIWTNRLWYRTPTSSKAGLSR
jgi:hypothetical protein